MNLFRKIKRHGFSGTVIIVWKRILCHINNMIYYAFWLFPVKRNLIVMESEGDLSDNAYALYDYMRREGFLNKYTVVWLVEDVKKAKKNRFVNTDFVIKYTGRITVKRNRYLATCGWYIYDHCNVMSALHKRKKQMVVYLSHGWGYKVSKGINQKNIKTHYDYLIATGPLAARGLSEYWGETLDKSLITGYPRIDYLFRKDDKVKSAVVEKWKFEEYEKIIFWMPTFRQSHNKKLSEDYIRNQTGLPLFTTSRELILFSAFLKKNRILLIFKLHHLQAELPVFCEKYDNIVVVRDEELKEMGIQLYQFVSFAEAMISDYSSISIDYLVLNRPLIFILDDYKQYSKSRGLFPENAIDYMPGYHVYNIKALEDSIMEICTGVDKYVEERREIISNYHTYLDGNSSKRVLDKVEIKI